MVLNDGQTSVMQQCDGVDGSNATGAISNLCNVID